VNQPVGFRRDSPDAEPIDGGHFSSRFQHMHELLFERERLL
jgi:hypothetical protein